MISTGPRTTAGRANHSTARHVSPDRTPLASSAEGDRGAEPGQGEDPQPLSRPDEVADRQPDQQKAAAHDPHDHPSPEPGDEPEAGEERAHDRADRRDGVDGAHRVPRARQVGQGELDDDGRHHAEHQAGEEEDRRRVDDDPRQERQREAGGDHQIRHHQDAEAGDSGREEDQPECPPGGRAVCDQAAQVVADRHAGQDDADDARPGVQGDPDVGGHDAPRDELDDQRARAAGEDDQVGDPDPAVREHLLPPARELWRTTYRGAEEAVNDGQAERAPLREAHPSTWKRRMLRNRQGVEG